MQAGIKWYKPSLPEAAAVSESFYSLDHRYVLDCLPPRENIVVVRARGMKIEDASGKVYTDLFSGISTNNLGHCHPEVVKAIATQAKRFMHVSAYYYHELEADLAQRLSAIAPRGLLKTFFCNSGTEAVDGSVKFCKLYASSRGKSGATVIALKGSFHGRLSLTLSLTGQRKFKANLGNYANYPGIVHTLSPYYYRYGQGLSEDEFGRRCADEIKDVIENYAAGDVAAVVVEPIMGEGGIIVPPDTFLPRVATICRDEEVPLVVDEVQTGFGRTGKNFACQHWSVEPDVMALAKALGGGLPLGAIMLSEKISKAIHPGDHFNTFFGNPVCCAAALAVISVMQRERLADRASRIGTTMLKRLGEAQEEVTGVGEVRGRGLMIGIELVKNRSTKVPAPELAQDVKKEMLRRGYIVGVGGIFKNVIRLQPPLIIPREEAERATSELVDSLKKASAP
ncbi:MAG TPA: aspartate aminotransferase family protein [Nitrososphaerales archaeon]|nr:aspartate aminotransferase family protein [Nitrososphaerales archaeon]